MTIPSKRILKTIAKGTGLTLLLSLFSLWLLPALFPQTVAEKVTQWVNGKINGELAFQEVSLSFFEHFPSLTLTLHHVSLKGAAPFQQENLLSADELAFGIDLGAIFQQEIFINKLYLNNGEINIQVDSLGKANYAIYQSRPSTPTASNEPNTAKLRLENIQINNCEMVYNDRSLPMLVKAHGFNYSGKGDLSKAVFDLYTHTSIDSLDFFYANLMFLLDKLHCHRPESLLCLNHDALLQTLILR
jgi:AsmA protein